MPVPRRAALALPALLLAGPARAAGFPDRPLRLIVPFAPGGNADTVGRILAPPLSERLGQPVIVENRAGAGGGVGALQAARARADGYTMLLGTNGPMAINPVIQPGLGYDPLVDFALLGLAARTPQALVVRRGLPAPDVAGFIAHARANPGRLTGGSSGVGSTAHLALETFNVRTGLSIQHVPYGSGGAMSPDLVAGNIDCAITEVSTALPLHRDGLARILGIASAARSVLAPDLPTLIEGGVPDFQASAFLGLAVPTGAPEEAQGRIAESLKAALALPETRRRLAETGTEVAAAEEISPAGFMAFLRAEQARVRVAAQHAGLLRG